MDPGACADMLYMLAVRSVYEGFMHGFVKAGFRAGWIWPRIWQGHCWSRMDPGVCACMLYMLAFDHVLDVFTRRPGRIRPCK